MKNIIVVIALFFSVSNANYGQIVVKGVIVDSISNIGIPGVQVYTVGKNTIGTITNSEGSYSLRLRENTDKIFFSHLTFNTVEQKLIKGKELYNLSLTVRAYKIPEIVVTPINANGIVDKAIFSLKDNHVVEPVCYNFYTRIANCSGDSTINLLEEHVGKIIHNKSHKSVFSIEKSRLGAFSKKGKKELPSHRMIGLMAICSDNMFRFKEDYLDKRHCKDYTYKYAGDLTIMGRDCYVINFTAKEKTFYRKGVLYIDKLTYGVAKKVLLEGDYEEITYQFIKNKWFLKSTNSIGHRIKDNNYYRVTIYNVSDKYDASLFSSLLPSKSKEFISDYNDNYWEDKNFVPLPNWMLQRMNRTKL